MEEKLQWFKQFVSYVLRRFSKDGCSAIAAELTVTSLLSLVPFLTVVFALLSLFPQFQSMGMDVQQWIFDNFIPESSQTIQNYLSQYIQNTRGLTSIGTLVLMLTSLMLMRTIDKSFNRIWQVKKQSSPVRVFLVYWAVLTMGPLLLALSLAVSSYFASLPLVSDVVRSQSGFFKRGIPMFMAFIAFTVMYLAVPNRKVKILHAVIAAVLTAILFELAKWGFGVFVQKFSTYQLIFGAIASVPLFLIWVLLSWMILLLGAELCHALEVFQLESEKEAGQPFVLAARILKRLVIGQKHRESVDLNLIQSAINNIRIDNLSDVVTRLIKAGLVLETEDGQLTLTGDSLDYRLIDILAAGIHQLPDRNALDLLRRDDPELATKLDKVLQDLESSLSDHLVGE